MHVLICRICNIKLGSMRAFHQHLKLHKLKDALGEKAKSQPYYCLGGCKKEFHLLHNLLRHVSTCRTLDALRMEEVKRLKKYKTQLHICQICHTETCKPVHLFRHIKNKHTLADGNLKTPYSCNCKEKFTELLPLGEHLIRACPRVRKPYPKRRTARGENPEVAYHCFICRSSFRHRGSLIQHIRLLHCCSDGITLDQPYPCNICEKEKFTDVTDLAQHQKHCATLRRIKLRSADSASGIRRNEKRMEDKKGKRGCNPGKI